MDGFNRINVVEERVSELEYKAEENTQMMHREAKWWKGLWNSCET